MDVYINKLVAMKCPVEIRSTTHHPFKISIMKPVLFLLLLFGASVSFACSCKEIGKITDGEIENVGEAFIGIVTEVIEDGVNFTITATFEVKHYLKGKLQSSELKVTTSKSGASCGLNFKKGEKWYVFSYYSDNTLHAGLCGRSAQLSYANSKVKRLVIGKKNYRKDKRRVRQDKKAIMNYGK